MKYIFSKEKWLQSASEELARGDLSQEFSIFRPFGYPTHVLWNDGSGTYGIRPRCRA